MRMNKIVYNKGFITLIISVIISSLSFAQTDVAKDTFLIVKPFEPSLSDAFKIKDNPAIKDTNKIMPELNYTFINKQVPVVFGIDTIKSARIKGEPLVKLYRGYAKLGFGTNSTPLAELYYNQKRSKNNSFGFFGKHLSSSGISSIDNSGFSDNHLEFFGKYFTKDFTIYGKADYNRSVVRYYGIPEAIAEGIIDATYAPKQLFNKGGFTTSLTRNYTDSSQFDYDAKLSYYHAKDRFNIQENHYDFIGNLSKYHKKELYQIGLDFHHNTMNSLFDSTSNVTVGLTPQISTIAKKWRFNVGIGLYVNAEDKTKFHFYPKAEFKYNVIENIIIPYVGITGGIIQNNLASFYAENPFINTANVVVANTNLKYDIYGGIRGSLSKSMTFNTSFSTKRLETMPLFVKDNSSVLDNKFIVLYDTATVMKIAGELTYQKLEKIKFLLGVDYYKYTLKNELKAWHKPDYKITLSGIYDLSDKIIVRADVFAIGTQYARTFNTTTLDTEAKELSGVIDANLSVEYRYTKKLSAFINFNNIGAVNYQRWMDYPTQKFGVLGGLTYSF